MGREIKNVTIGDCPQLSHFLEVKAKGVHADAEAGQAHGGGSEHGREGDSEMGNQHTGCQRNSYTVIEEGPEKVLLYIGHCCTTKLYGCGYLL